MVFACSFIQVRAKRLAKDELQELKLRRRRVKKPKMLLTKKTNLWMVYEIIQCIIQLAALALLFMYGVQHIPQANFRPNFDVYDADSFAPARFFLTKRNDANLAAAHALAQQGVCAHVCKPSITPPPTITTVSALSPPLPLMPGSDDSVSPSPPLTVYDEYGKPINTTMRLAAEMLNVDSCSAW